jgi:4'-phosphopantetheinyl transferase
LFDYAAHGKPSLRATPGADSLRFNVSNTADVAVVAVAQELDLGVDVEQVRHLEDARALAHRFFAAAERAALDSLPAAELDAAFFRCWTRKEAVLKALGSGLAWPLNQFAVSLAVDAPRVESFQGPTSDDAPWRLLHLVPAEGYVGALATRGAPVKVHTWSFAG